MYAILLAPLIISKAFSSFLPDGAAPSATTDNAQISIVKRDNTNPTIYLGDIHKYIFDGSARQPDVQTLGKREVTIAPDGFHDEFPEKGITIAFGEEIAEEVRKTIEGKCKDGTNLQSCVKDVHDTLTKTDLSTHTKRFVVLAAGTVALIVQWLATVVVSALIVGVGAALLEHNKAAKIHLPHENNGPLAQIQTLGDDVSEVAFAMGDNEESNVLATVTIAPTPAPEPSPTERVRLEEITTDNDKHKKGDILVHIPRGLNDRLGEYVAILGRDQVREVCAADRSAHAVSRRSEIMIRADNPVQVSEQCRTAIRDLSRSTMFTLDDRTAMQLIPLDANNPANLETHPDGAVVPKFDIDELNIAIQLARQYQRRRGFENRPAAMNLNRAISIATTIFIYVSEITLRMEILHAVAEVVEWSVESIQKITVKDATCPTDLICFADDCNGYKEIKSGDPKAASELEQTEVCTEKPNNGCPCEVLPRPFVRIVPENHFDNMQHFMSDIDEDISRPHCSTEDFVNFDTARFDEAIGGACRDHDELRRRGRYGAAIIKREGFKYDNTDKDNLRWTLSWEDSSANCNLKCEDVFKKMLYYDKCRWWGGAAKSGSVRTECGKASYEVDYAPTPPPEKPQLPENWHLYFIVLDHEIRGPGDWTLTWELFVIPADRGRAKVKVEGPATNRDVSATPFAMHISVDNADEKDKAKLRFSFAERSKPEEMRDAPWYAGAQGDMGELYFGFQACHVEGEETNWGWYEAGGAWKRRVACRFSKELKDIFLAGSLAW